MKQFISAEIMLLITVLFQIISSEDNFIKMEKPFKPFISVLNPETIEKYKEAPKKTENKFLSKDEFQPFISANPISLDPLISFGEDKNQSTAEVKLREIKFSVKCMLVDDFSLYDISGLGINFMKENKRAYNQTVDGTNIYYNFCYDLQKIDGCNYDKKQIFAVTGEGNDTSCEPLANSINKGNTWNTGKNTSDNSTFLQIELNSDESKNHKIFYILKCNKDQKELKYYPDRSYYKRKTTEDNKTFDKTVLYFETKEACEKYNFYVIWQFVNDYSFIFASIIIAFGLFNCIAGNYLAKYTTFLLILFGVVVLTFILFQFILPSGCAQWIIWVILVIGIIVGCAIGVLVFKHYKKFISFLVGGLAGFLLGEFLFNLFGNKININSTLVNILFIIVAIIAAILLAYWLKDIIVILATAFIGAYAFIRGISIFAGYFPSEFTIIDLKNRGEKEQLDELITWRFYVYLTFIVFTFALSVFIQIMIRRHCKKKEEEEAPDENLVSKKDDDD